MKKYAKLFLFYYILVISRSKSLLPEYSSKLPTYLLSTLVPSRNSRPNTSTFRDLEEGLFTTAAVAWHLLPTSDFYFVVHR